MTASGPGQPWALPLTPAQRKQLSDEAGIDAPHLQLTDVGFRASALAARALVSKGELAGVTHPILLDLDDEQRALLHDRGLSATSLVVDPDGLTVGYYDDWTAGTIDVAGTAVRIAGGGDQAAGDICLSKGEAARLFGTGRHPTTTVAAELLSDVLVRGARVCDLGSGAGLLSLLAVRWGAASVTAVDVDPRAVAATRENARLNGMDEVVAVQGDVQEVDGEFDVVLANLLPAVLLRSVPTLERIIPGGGFVIVAGIVDARLVDVLDRLPSSGWMPVTTRSRRGWSSALLRRRTT